MFDEAIRPDDDNPERYEIRYRWHEQRVHRGGPVGGGDLDFLGDESLYHSLGLGKIGVYPERVDAGSQVEEPIVLTFTAGTHGLPEGSSVHFVMRGQSPLGFWLQAVDRNAPGYFEIIGPSYCRFAPHLVGFQLIEGHLTEGDQVRLVVKDTDRLVWTKIAGRREFKAVINLPNASRQRRLPEPAVITILPLGLDRIEATLPCTRLENQPVPIHVTARDIFDNRVPIDGPLTVSVQETAQNAYMKDGVADAVIAPTNADSLRATVRLVGHELECNSNVSIAGEELNLYIGDLHCHDCLSEAEGYPDEIYRWAIEDRNLDFVSVVPQCHGWLDNETWDITKYMNERYLDEGKFVTFLGFEWQHTGYGDKVVHFLNGDQPYLPVDDVRYNSTSKLYDALRASDALVVSHHPACPPGSWCSNTDFDVVETDVERLVELWSMHGSSEGHDPSDRPLSQVYERSYVMAALRRGVRLGFVAGSDTHSGRPGGSAKEPMRYWGGLAAVWAPSLTRRGISEALRARRTYALTGARIILKMSVNGALMGSEIPQAGRAEISIEAWCPGRIGCVELLRNAELLHTFRPGGDECHLEFEDSPDGPAFYHCRVTQEDGHLAVCSPVWVRGSDE